MSGGIPHPPSPEQDRRAGAERLYDRALTLDPEERAGFLDEACRNDPGLREELQSLLERAEGAEAFFEHLRDSLFSSPSSIMEAFLEGYGGGRDAPSFATPHFPVGHVVGHYRIVERIGAGGMGTVYRAHDTRLDRDVALKFLPPHLSTNHDAAERLLVEARAAAGLEHTNVCTVHEIGETDDGWPFIAMALCEGETLKERLRRGPLPPEEALEIAKQIARGLAVAHAHGIVHRDVKPANVVLTPDGTVKLLDFGLAKLADVTLTRAGVTPGTVAYMSPEQARGDTLNPRTDLWSLGVVLYEMFACVRPFRGGNDRAVIQAILHEEPEPLSKRATKTPASLQRIVDRLLRKDLKTRYGSADELLADLARARSGGLAAPAISFLRQWMPERTIRRVALGTTGVLAALALFLGIRTIRDSAPLVPAADGIGGAPAIAVLPFSVHGQNLDVWREGMVDLLSMGLDGAGGLRAIDSRTLLARWNEEVGEEGMIDLPHALGVARRTRASYALVGSAVSAGPQVRFAADVYNIENGQSLGQALVEGPPDSILTLVDRLGMRVLAIVFQDDPDLPAIDLAGVTTSSLPALKAYLEGEVSFRRTELTAAVEAWERAVRADTLFALAYFGLAEAYGWDETRDWDRGGKMLDRALRLADRLPAREAAMVRAKWALRNGESQGLAAVEEAVREYPHDAEAWYNLGEAYHHLAGAMQGPEDIERAFRRAAELQPTSALHRAHLLDLAFSWQPDSVRVVREVGAYARLAPQAARTRAGRIAFALAFGDAGARAQARAALDTLDPELATQAYMFLGHPRLTTARETVFRAIDPRPDDETVGLLRFTDVGLTDGRIRQALKLLDDPGTPDIVRHCAPLHLSIRGLAVPEEILEETLSVSRADSSAFASRSWVTCAAAHAAGRGRWRQHGLLLSHAREVVRRELAAGDSARAREWEMVVREAEAHGLWRRGRKAEALPAFESALSNDALAWRALWYVGQLAFELGRLDLAERAFRALWSWDGPPAYLYLGRIYERTGRPAEAVKAYEFVIYAWRNADPELQPLIDEARQAITRLSGAKD